MRQRCVLDGDLRLGSTPFFAHSFILWFCSLNGNRRMAFLRRNVPRTLMKRFFCWPFARNIADCLFDCPCHRKKQKNEI